MLLQYEDLKSKKGIRYSRDHLRRRVKAKTFPAPIQVGDHYVAWVESEIDEWIAQLIAERDGGPARLERMADPAGIPAPVTGNDVDSAGQDPRPHRRTSDHQAKLP